MSRVVRVGVHDLNIEAALKLPQTSEPATVGNFNALADREYQLIGNLRHPGLVRLLESPSTNPSYLLLELCEGFTVDKIPARLNYANSIDLISAIAASLEFVRAQGIVHGDVKPHNIFVPQYFDQPGEPCLFFAKLSDFAFGRFESESDDSRLGLGTVGYMAPETVTDSISSHASDLFALGVVAYELLVGKHPFSDGLSDPAEINSRVREFDPQPPSQLCQNCNQVTSELVMQLLSKDWRDRPETAWEICQKLGEAGASYPYRSVLRPSHFFGPSVSYAGFTEQRLSLSKGETNRLESLTGGNLVTTRLILAANFRLGNLDYESGIYRFRSRIIWPSRLRRKLLGNFIALSLNDKKQIVRWAVEQAGDRYEREQKYSSQFPGAVPALASLLMPLLSTATVKRLSRSLSPFAESSGRNVAATVQYLICGDLAGAERCACVAANELRTEHSNRQALELLGRVIEYADTTDKLFEVRQLLMLTGDIQKDQGKTDTALKAYEQIVELYAGRSRDSLLAETYKDLGDLFRRQQDFDRGLAALNESLSIYTELGDDLEISHTRNNIGNMYWVTNEFQKAVQNYRSALKIQRRFKSSSGVASTLNNIAAVFCMQGRYRRAIRLFLLALGIQREIGKAGEIARTLNNLGYIYHLQGEASKAVTQLTESLELNRKIGSQAEILHNLDNLTSVMITAGKLRRLLPYVKEGIALSSDLSDKAHLGQFQLNLAITCKRTGRFQEAKEALDRVEGLLDGIQNPLLRASWASQRAGLELAKGNLTGAAKLAAKALDLAEASGDAACQLNTVLLKIHVDADENLVTRAYELVESLKLRREAKLITFARAARILANAGESGLDILLALGPLEPPIEDDDIEIPQMCNTASEISLRQGRLEEASRYSRRSERLAAEAGLLPELVVAHLLSGQISFEQGEYEAAFVSFKKGLGVAKKLASGITDDDERQQYLHTRSLTELATGIRKLNLRLGKSKRQVN